MPRRRQEGLPFRHRTPGRRRLGFARAQSQEDDAPQWLRRLLARPLAAIERRMGARLSRVDEPRVVNEPLGCGAFGCVFALDDGRVLKVTSDELEGPLSEQVRTWQRRRDRVERFSVLAVTARVDDIFVFPRQVTIHEDPQPIYGIVREQVDVSTQGLSVAFVEALDLYNEGWDHYCGADEDQVGVRVLGAAVARVGLDDLKHSGVAGRRMADFIRWSWNQGIPFMDLHSGNVGVRLKNGPDGARRGQPVVFDFGGVESFRVGDCPGGPIGLEIGKRVDYKKIKQRISSL